MNRIDEIKDKKKKFKANLGVTAMRLKEVDQDSGGLGG